MIKQGPFSKWRDGSDRTKMVLWHWQRHCLCVWRPHYFVSTIVNSTWGYGGVVSHPNWRSWLQSLPGKFCNLTLTRCLKMVFPMLSQNVINSYTNLLHYKNANFKQEFTFLSVQVKQGVFYFYEIVFRILVIARKPWTLMSFGQTLSFE